MLVAGLLPTCFAAEEPQTAGRAEGAVLASSALAAFENSAGKLGIPAVAYTKNAQGDGTYTVTLQILAVMTALTLLPSMLMMMTAFTRIIVVFAILRQALGLQQTPSNQVLLGLALFLSIFVMSPVLQEANRVGLQPYLNEQLAPLAAVQSGAEPFRQFMLGQTREDDLSLFLRISNSPKPNTAADVSFFVLAPAFVTSELKTAFQIGFLLFIPFLVIDLVVASVLMSMGMMMLSPIIISLPFKLMLFVLVDGWAMVVGSLASSFGLG
ncbi:MAG: flagellar type III secretion system pore protein FliP [Pseudomonadales bacterium]|nr:flagellar type III secretion system pore protein FliP [Pseudomonadales bacterium]